MMRFRLFIVTCFAGILLVFPAMSQSCPPLQATAAPDCATGTAQLNAAAGFTSYSWTPAATLSNPNIVNPVATAAGSYSLTATYIGPELVINPDFSAGTTGFTSGLINSTSYSPGNYWVGPVWFTIAMWNMPDHSPSTDNMYMSIDGDPAGSTMIWEEGPLTVQPNSVYNFEFWASRADQVQPTFEIHFIGNVTGDNILATTPGIPYTGTWTWDAYGVPSWNSGANTSVTIRVIDLQGSAYGDDFGLDDFSFRESCTSTDVVNVVFMPQPVSLGADVSLCDSYTLTLDAGVPGAVYQWSTGDTTQTISVTSPGQYSVTVSGSNCVSGTDVIEVSGMAGEGLLFIPNSFTPDGNGTNEKFLAYGENITVFRMRIFDRWGELIFETNDFAKGWDGSCKGELAQEDTYVYVIDYQTECNGAETKKRIGNVNVIR